MGFTITNNALDVLSARSYYHDEKPRMPNIHTNTFPKYKGKSDNYIILTEMFMELHNYLRISMIGTPSYLMLTYFSGSFSRKHNISQYIVVAISDFVAIPKSRQQSTLFLKFPPVNNDIIF